MTYSCRTLLRAGVLAALLPVLVSGCTAASPGSARVATAASATSGTPAPAPAGTPTPSMPSASATSPASTQTATGPVLKRRTFTIRLPEGFSLDPKASAGYSSGSSADLINGVTAYEDVSERAPSLGVMVGWARSGPIWRQRPKRLADVRIAGQKWYHLHGQQEFSKRFTHIDAHEYGTYHGHTVIWIDFSFDTRDPAAPAPAARQALIDSVLATVHWR